jgi:tripartite-type tricarboxylate transporter receptor subunit TctC
MKSGETMGAGSGTVRLLVGFSEGSASNIVAQMIAPALGNVLNQTIRVERIEGENGALCGEVLARARADGQTLAIAIQANIIGSLMHKKKRYDPLVDFAPVSLIAKSPMVLVVSNTLNVKTAAELIALARAQPGQVAYAASAVGGAPHLAGVLFDALAGTRMRLKVYKETNTLWEDLAAGRAAVTFNNVMSALPLARAGKVRILAVTARERSVEAPEIPTLSEAGLADYEIVNFVGIVAPAATPAPMVANINAAIAQAVATPEVRASLRNSGMESIVGTPADFAHHMRLEIERWKGFIQANNALFTEPV